METFSALLALCAENSLVTGELPSQCQWRGASVFSLICAWVKVWVNNRDAGDLRRHHTHYDVTAIHIYIYIYIYNTTTSTVLEEAKNAYYLRFISIIKKKFLKHMYASYYACSYLCIDISMFTGDHKSQWSNWESTSFAPFSQYGGRHER